MILTDRKTTIGTLDTMIPADSIDTFDTEPSLTPIDDRRQIVKVLENGRKATLTIFYIILVRCTRPSVNWNQPDSIIELFTGQILV